MSNLQGTVDTDGAGQKLLEAPVGSLVRLSVRSSVACQLRPLGVDTTPLPIPADSTVYLGIIDLGVAVVDQTTAGEEVGWWADYSPRRGMFASGTPAALPPPPPSGGGGAGTKPPSGEP